MTPWYRQKTTWTGIAGIVAAIGGYFTGDIGGAAAVAAIISALGLIFLRQGVAKAESGRVRVGLLFVVVVGFAVLFAGCQSGPTPATASLSPSQPSSAGAGQGQGAQTIGGNQGTGQTPQNTPGGQATQTWYFASQGSPEVLSAILAAAQAGNWTAEQTINAIKASSGAPDTVTITVGPQTVQGGSATATGATSGVGSGNAGIPGTVSNK